MVPIPRLPLEGIKVKVELAKIEVVTPELVVTNPINCGVDAEDIVTVFGTNPVKLAPDPENEVAVTTQVTLASPMT